MNCLEGALDLCLDVLRLAMRPFEDETDSQMNEREMNERERAAKEREKEKLRKEKVKQLDEER